MQAVTSHAGFQGRDETGVRSEAGSERILLLVGPLSFLLMVFGARLVEWRLLGGEAFPATPQLPMAAFVSQLGSLAADLWWAIPVVWLFDRGLRRLRG